MTGTATTGGGTSPGEEEAPTLLDAAHAALVRDPENEVLRLRFYERLADGELYLLLAREAGEGDEAAVLEPRVFALEEGPVVLVFDREERLAAFSGGVAAPWAALPGRVIAGMLKGRGIGLGVNLGVAPSHMLLPAEAVDWLAAALEGGPEEGEATPEELLPPAAPEALVAALDAKLARAAGLATAAFLAGVRYGGGRRAHLLAFLEARPGAEAPLARAVREALVFSGLEDEALDVTFLGPDAAAGGRLLAAFERVALRFDLSLPEGGEGGESGREGPRPGPGLDPPHPPSLGRRNMG